MFFVFVSVPLRKALCCGCFKRCHTNKVIIIIEFGGSAVSTTVGSIVSSLPDECGWFENMLPFCQNRSALAHCALCGWICICVYMCAEWEQGHRRGLGFLSEHHPQAVLHLIVKPPLVSSLLFGLLLSAASLCSSRTLTPLSFTRLLLMFVSCMFFVYASQDICTFMCLTGALRKNNSPAKWDSCGSGSVSFWLTNIRHPLRMSSSSNETMQIEAEVCGVIKAVAALHLSVA